MTQKKRNSAIRLNPLTVEALALLLVLHFITQTWVTLSAKPGIDYIFYYQGVQSALEHGSPYWSAANYIYPPPLAILLMPLAAMNPTRGYILWALILCIAYGYTFFRSGSVGQRLRARSSLPRKSPSTTDK